MTVSSAHHALQHSGGSLPPRGVAPRVTARGRDSTTVTATITFIAPERLPRAGIDFGACEPHDSDCWC